MITKIFNTQAVDGPSAEIVHPGGQFAVLVWGGLGGGTVTLEVLSIDGSTWVPDADNIWTAPGIKIISYPPTTIRLSLVGATAATLEAQVTRV